MNVSEISFCDRIGFNIKSDESKGTILSKLEQTYKLKIVTKHFETFEERFMSTINNNLHLITTRTNGNPYFLYLVKINFTNYCIFIDKKIQQGYFFPRMIISHIFFDDSLFENDLIFDGEMTQIKDEDASPRWVFFINDILVYKGKHLGDMNLVKRINLCYEILSKYHKPTDTDIFRIMVKKYFKYHQLTYLIDEFIPSRKYSCRGIYFKPLYLKFKDILVNFDNSLICKVERVKYKNVKNFLLNTDITQSSVSSVSASSDTCSSSSGQDHENVERTFNPGNKQTRYLAKKTHNPDVYELYDNQNNLVGTAAVPGLNLSKKMRELFSKVNMVTKIEIQCEYSDKFNKWIPII